MPNTITSSFVQASLTPYKLTKNVALDDYPVAANNIISMGEVVAITTGVNTDDVQTLTSTATAGSFSITVGNAQQATTPLLASQTLTGYQLCVALSNAFASLCPGGPSAAAVSASAGATGTSAYCKVTTTTAFGSGVGSLVVTFNNGTANTGVLSNNPQTLMVINGGALTAANSVTIAHTTVGINNSAIVPYVGTLITSPTTAPTLSDNATAGTFGVSTYTVVYTFSVDAARTQETLPSYPANINIGTTAHSIGVASITGIPSAALYTNYYVNGVFVKQATNANGASGAAVLSAAASATPGDGPPRTNTAFLNTDGSQQPIGAAWYAMAAGPDGQITFGGTAPTGNEYRPRWYTGNVAISGYFLCANLNIGGVAGIDANTANTLGRLISGSISTGVVVFTGAN